MSGKDWPGKGNLVNGGTIWIAYGPRASTRNGQVQCVVPQSV